MFDRLGSGLLVDQNDAYLHLIDRLYNEYIIAKFK